MIGELNIFDSPDELSKAAADCWQQLSAEAIQARGRFTVALSGGTTPKRLFTLLAQEPYRSSVDWKNCVIFFGDERWVAHDHAESNFRMAKESLFDHITCPTKNIFPIPTDGVNAAQDAARYQQQLQQQFNTNIIFDLVFLGLGADGHTASLFPGTSALQETSTPTCAVYVEKMQSWRITLTYPVINQARQIIFLVEGEGKAEILHRIIDLGVDVPATHVSGNQNWFIDRHAASQLSDAR
ncbi:MAG: 6-phosphogluconolactonase [Gammaproteobacteria bacterium]|nr:6-phosphogluconolactonase [Gammaproteobacteria bacterium]